MFSTSTQLFPAQLSTNKVQTKTIQDVIHEIRNYVHCIILMIIYHFIVSYLERKTT